MTSLLGAGNAQDISLYEFRFPDRPTQNDLTGFPMNGIGIWLHSRSYAVQKAFEKISTFSSGGIHSLYFRGPKGSGKSTLLQLIGRELQDKGHKVFLVEAGELSKIPKSSILKMESDCDDNVVYFLVVEVQQNPDDSNLNYILKNSKKIHAIGTGVPQHESTTSQFDEKFEFTELIQLSIEDLDEAIEIFKVKCDISDAELVKRVLEWTLEYTGGHAFPFFTISSYLLEQQRKACENGDMESVVTSSAFVETKEYMLVHSRSLSLTSILPAAHKVLKNDYDTAETNLLNKFGVWDVKKKWFVSNFFVQYFYSNFDRVSEKDVHIDLSSANVLEEVILFGLKEMVKSDFYDPITYSKRYETSIGANFGAKLASLPHLYISPQTVVTRSLKQPGQSPTIDFYLNGKLNMYLELTRDGSQIAAHFDKFEKEDGPYYKHRDRYAIIDFNFELKKEPVLPRQYAHKSDSYYTFSINTNTLYRGRKVIKTGASRFLPAVRSMSTLTKLLRFF